MVDLVFVLVVGQGENGYDMLVFKEVNLIMSDDFRVLSLGVHLFTTYVLLNVT